MTIIENIGVFIMLWKIIILGFVGLLLAIISLTVIGQVTVTQTSDGNVVLNGNVNGMNPERQPAASQSTTSSFYMNKKIWSRNQQDWHSPGFGAESMRTFVNNALASGIRLSKIGTSTTQIEPFIFICLNDAGRLLMYCFRGEAIGPPPEPAKCTIVAPNQVNFGTATVGNLLKVDDYVTVECSQPTKVTLSLQSPAGEDKIQLGQDAVSQLFVGPKRQSNSYVYEQTINPMDIPIGFDLIDTGLSAGEKVGSALLDLTIL
ncbi:hypothetical protein QZQ97_24325 [Serratia sp. root2]|uniref:hypothetical protein n=1 Tax=Serratia sp. root2 TaxID=3059676 RepID=UPI002890EA73|nr:hypothetical protein [Serratia sp. root2]MDT3254047.1 hypothetical protein [Serratia sp. root2]